MRFSLKKISRSTLMLLACSLLSGPAKPMQARDNFWSGNVNDSWNITGNWSFAGPIAPLPRVPADIDTAVLASPVGDDVRLFGNTAPIDGLIVGNGIDLFTNGFRLEVDKAGSAIASVAGGASIHVEPRSVFFGRTFVTDDLFLLSDGTVLLQGGDALVEGKATLTDGGGIHGSNAASNIRFGGDITMNQAVIRLFNGADASFSANATFLAELGSIAFIKQQINVINDMTFDFRSGSRLEVESLNIGNNGLGTGSVGSLLLDANGSNSAKVTVDLDLDIGHATNGSGLLDMKKGIAAIIRKSTVHPTGTLRMDDSQFAALGDLLVNGGTITSVNRTNPLFLPGGGKITATNRGNITIDGSQEIRANGTFEFFSGADLDVTGTMTVGTDIGDTGTLTLNGAGSMLSIGTNLIVGDEQQQGIVGLSGGAVGNVSGNVAIGNDGMGTLTLESGAMLSDGFSRVGGSSTSSGMVTVTGAGSTWNNSSFLTIGSSGTGQLKIEDGGQVFSASGFLGADSNASGTVTVGSGSAWTISGDLSVGGGSFGDIGGSGTVNIQAGGAVNVGTVLVVYSNDKIRLSGGTLTAQTIDLRGGQLQWTSGTLHTEMSLGNILNQGGTLAPGKSTDDDEIGLTTIDGNYTQQTGGALALEIAGNQPITTYDQVSVTGIALLDGDLELTTRNGFQPQLGNTFTVLSALGGIAGVFDNVTTGGRLDTVNGLGSFLVHYGPGSLFSDNQIVLSDYIAAFLTGDYNGDGFVGQADLDLVLLNWGDTVPPNPVPAGWVNQQPSGLIGQQALDGVLLNWGAGAQPLVAVPEPVSAVLLLLALIPFSLRCGPRNRSF